jgi:2-polyprenyl-6-methoxyphenol hydroxylase-like FAD-dependent oxidoreductase
MISSWHPNLRRLVQLTDPTTTFPINIRTSVPVDPWESSHVTLLGDAIHTMTPGRGVGANTALRDAALLCQTLTKVRNGHESLIEALHQYEAEMLRYSADAILDSRKQMDARDMIHKPIIGRLQLAAMRTTLRIMNAVPKLKHRMQESQMRLRTVQEENS